MRSSHHDVHMDRHRRGSTALLVLLLTVQFALTLIHANYPLIGDELYWVAKAQYLAEQGRLPKIDRESLDVQNGLRHGNSDWRPQAYTVFVVLCSLGDFEHPGSGLRRRVVGAQFLLLASVLLALHALVLRSGAGRGTWYAAAALFGGTPWVFEFADSIGEGPLNAAVVTIGLLLLWRWTALPGGGRSALFVASLIVSSTLLIRADMIVSGPAAIGFAMLLRRPALKDLCVAALAVSLPLAAQVTYRTWATGTPGIYGGLHIENHGAFKWVSTWPGTEKEGYDFIYALSAGWALPLPERAFLDSEEKAKVLRIVSEVVRRGHYTAEDDAAFERLAAERRRKQPIRVVALRGWHALHVWVNSENPKYVLQSLASVPRKLRRPVYGALLLLKLGCLVAASIAICRALYALVRGRADRFDKLTLLLGAFLVSRTALMALVLNWKVHRYLLPAWPSLVWCATRILPPRSE